MGEGRRSVSLVLFLSSPLSYLFCSPSPSLFLPFLHLCLSIIPLPLFLHPPLLSIPLIPHFLHLLKSSFILPPSSSSLPPLPRFPFFFNSFSSSVLSLHHFPLFLTPLSSSLPSLPHFPLFFTSLSSSLLPLTLLNLIIRGGNSVFQRLSQKRRHYHLQSRCMR